jgi:CrcB protein
MADPPLTVPAAVAVGGTAGAAARYGVSRLITVSVGGFPCATLVVNVTGAFAIGALVAVLAASVVGGLGAAAVRLALATA